MDFGATLKILTDSWPIVVTLGSISITAGGHLIGMQRKVSRLLTAVEVLDSIKKELSTNGGSSMKDALNAIRDDVRLIAHKQTLLTNYNPQPVIECNAKGECVWINTTGLETLRLHNSDYRNFGWLGALRHSRVNLRDEWEAAIESGSSWSHEATTVEGKPLVIDMQCVRDGAKVLGWLGTVSPSKKS